MEKSSYVTVSISRKVAERLDKFLDTNYAEERGHNSRAGIVLMLLNTFLDEMETKRLASMMQVDEDGKIVVKSSDGDDIRIS